MPLELTNAVLVTVFGWNVRPHTFVTCVPGTVAQECYPGRRVAEAQRVVQIEVLQLVGTDDSLARLDLRRAFASRNQLRADLRTEHLEQRIADLRPQALRLRHPADDVLNKRLGHAGVDAVMGHV